MRGLCFAGIYLWTALTAAVQAGAAEPVSFDRDIRPLLNAHCVACHGGVKKAGGISFLSREAALAEADSGGHAIVPGSPGESELLRRVTTVDDDERMPPITAGR